MKTLKRLLLKQYFLGLQSNLPRSMGLHGRMPSCSNSNNVRKTLNVIMPSLSKLQSYVLKRTETVKKLFVLGTLKTKENC